MKPCGHRKAAAGCPVCRLSSDPRWAEVWADKRRTPAAPPPSHPAWIDELPQHKGCCPKEQERQDMGNKWAVGVTTVPKRADSLRRTLTSMKAAGFDKYWLFYDGDAPEVLVAGLGPHGSLGYTCRSSPARVHGNWVLALSELWIRNWEATRFMVVQDDVVFCRGVREYLDATPWAARSYLNLYTNPRNAEHLGKREGWSPSNGEGLGALALVFDRQAVMQLLTSHHMLMRPVPDEEALHKVGLEAIRKGEWYRGQSVVDGGIVTAMKQVGYHERVHNPSLVQHTGDESSFSRNRHRPSPCFLGEEFDLRSMIR